jgi:hypothetical protein
MKMTDSYDKLREKFQHFEKYDAIKFNDIFKMKFKEGKDLAMKILLADRTIKTQQLGIETFHNDNPEGYTLEELQKEQDFEILDEDKQEINNEIGNFKQDIFSRMPTERVKQVFSYIVIAAEFLIDLQVNYQY